MGWWSVNILGGDTPLDVVEIIAGVLRSTESKQEPWFKQKEPWFKRHGLLDIIDGTTKPKGKQQALMSQRILDSLDDIEEKLRGEYLRKDDPDNYRCAMQVLGLLCRRLELAPPPTLLDTIIKACDEDEWAQESRSRKEVVSDLKQSLLSLASPASDSLGLG